jgi:hypothetical protein
MDSKGNTIRSEFRAPKTAAEKAVSDRTKWAKTKVKTQHRSKDRQTKVDRCSAITSE